MCNARLTTSSHFLRWTGIPMPLPLLPTNSVSMLNVPSKSTTWLSTLIGFLKPIFPSTMRPLLLRLCLHVLEGLHSKSLPPGCAPTSAKGTRPVPCTYSTSGCRGRCRLCQRMETGGTDVGVGTYGLGAHGSH